MSEFAVGDYVVYPPHGAGTVIAKEKRDGAGAGEYLSIRILHSKMTLMVPAHIAAEKGVREIMALDAVDDLLAILGAAGKELAENAQHRMRGATEKAKTGEVLGLAEVIRDLHGRENDGKKLSPGEQKTLLSAKEHLASELMYVKDISVDEALELIEQSLAVAPEPEA